MSMRRASQLLESVATQVEFTSLVRAIHQSAADRQKAAKLAKAAKDAEKHTRDAHRHIDGSMLTNPQQHWWEKDPEALSKHAKNSRNPFLSRKEALSRLRSAVESLRSACR